jgi:hypothetical protein
MDEGARFQRRPRGLNAREHVIEQSGLLLGST